MVAVEREVAWTELERRLRETPLLRSGEEDEVVYPYEYADIRLARVAYADVAPTSLYVLRKNLAVQAAIACELSVEGFHALELEGGLVLRDDNGKEEGLIPPIVEESDADGKYVLDGAHRTSMGRWLGRTHFVAAHISGIRPDCPSYALPNDWDEIRIMEEVPKNPAEKKHYRGEDYKALYRDFSQLNGSRLREAQ
jgi:hypothetical protein